MKIAPIPADEEKRLAALAEYQIVDTAAEAIFDNITAVASAICETPISTITLVDRDRQWYKSQKGLGDVTETSRDIAFCSHTILNSTLMEITDATKDERFADNPLVVNNPSIRFYAGMPLIDSGGHKLGALCVLDKKPKVLSESQKAILKNLSAIVIHIFEIRKGILSDINQRKIAAEELAMINSTLQAKLQEQNQNKQELMLLNEMSGLLQTCMSVEEVYQILIKYGSRLFPDSAGILSLLTSTNHLSMVSGWGLQTIAKKTFIANACQALRHHPLHATDNQHTDASCEHLHNDKLSDHLCMPLVAQGKIIGLLSITYPSIFRQYKMSETDHLLAVAMSEQVGLALANAKLRQTLYQQSMFDPLTGLYNRRYLTDMLKADLISTQKNHGNIAFIMIDIDFFKRFNDKYGHDAGDQVLVQTSKLLTASLSPDSHACRFGGEEFIVVLKNTSLEAAKRWAEKLCETIKLNPIQHKGVTLDTITLSIGIAVFPAHGQDVNQLLVAADLALYQAKGAGRNQVVICEISLGGNSTGMDAKKDQAID